MDKKYKINIRVLVEDPEKDSPDDIYKISGEPHYILGALTSALYNVAKKADYSHDEIKELTINAFDHFRELDKLKEDLKNAKDIDGTEEE